jgi:hypothetical protein
MSDEVMSDERSVTDHAMRHALEEIPSISSEDSRTLIKQQKSKMKDAPQQLIMVKREPTPRIELGIF